jgi:hypothetical protein
MADLAQTSDDDEHLLEYLRPLCDVMIELADASLELGGSVGLPAAESLGMAELAEEHRFSNERWSEPVRASHTTASILCLAAGDHLRSFGRLFLSQPVPVYSHLVLARACLDACGVGYWLSETGIGLETRIQRFLVHRMADALDVKRSPIPAVKAKGRAALDEVVQRSNLLGWGATKSKPRVGDVTQVSPKRLIRTVLDDDRTFGADQLGSSEILWWYLSGATHSAVWALMQSIDSSTGETSASGDPLAAVLTNGESVRLIALTIARAFAAVTEEHAALMGWHSDRWAAARDALTAAGRAIVASSIS